MSEALKHFVTHEDLARREQEEREKWVELKATELIKEAEIHELQTQRVEKLDNAQRWGMMIRIATQIIEDLNKTPVQEGEGDKNLFEERRRLRATAEFICQVISAEKIIAQKAALDQHLRQQQLARAAEFANISQTVH